MISETGTGWQGLGKAQKREVRSVFKGVKIMEIINHAGLSDEELRRIGAVLGRQRSLKDLIRWAKGQPAGALRPTVVVDVVIQDEFSHDVIVPWGQRLTLVYETS